MALQIEQQTRDFGVVRTTLGPERTRVVVRPGDAFRFVDDAGQPIARAPRLRVRRLDNNLIIDGLPDGREVELNNFFGACRPGAECTVSLAGVGLPGAAAITEESLPTAALQDGSFLLYSDNTDSAALAALPAAKVADATGPSWLAIGGAAAGIGIAAAAAGGGGGGGGGSETDTTPPGAPIVTSGPVVRRSAAVVSGEGEPGARITLRVDANGNGVFSDPGDLTFVTTVGTDGRWQVDLNGTPQSGTPPAGGLVDGSYAILVVATDASLNASPATRASVLLDGVSPVAPTIDAIGAADVVNAAARAQGVTVAGSAEPGSTVAVTWGATTLTGIAGANGRFSIGFPPAQVPADGTSVPATATATDAAGNTGPATARGVLVDTTPPAAPTFTGGPITNVARPTISGTAEPGSTVRLSVDTGNDGSFEAGWTTTANTSGTWSVNTATTPPDGASVVFAGFANNSLNGLRASATDAVGNAGAARTQTLGVDFAAPSAPTIAAVAGDDIVNGTERGAGITVFGTLPDATYANRPVTVSWGSVSRVATFTGGAGTAWQVAFAAGEVPADGSTTITAAYTSVAGTPSLTGARNVLIDTVPPGVPVAALASDTGTSATDGLTRNGQVNLTGLEAGATWQYSVNGGTTWTAGTGSSVTLTGDGPRSVVFRQTDSAGNVGAASTALTFTLDTTAPAAPGAALASDTGSSPTDRVTTSGLVNITALDPGAAWEYSLNGGTTWIAGPAPVAGASSITVTGDGARTVQVRQTDAAGNVSTVTSLAFTLDTAPPAAPGGTLTNDTGTPGDGLTQDGRITLSGVESGAAWQYSLNGGTTWVPGTGSVLDLTATGDGPKSVLLRQVDLAGNTGAASATPITFTLDTTAPAAAPTGTIVDTGISAVDRITNNGTVTVSLAGLESGASWQYSLNAGSSWTTGTGTTVAVTGDGARSMLLRQVDAAGNPGTPGTALTFTLDTTAPAVATTTDSVPGALAVGPVTFTFNFTEPIYDLALADFNVSGGTAFSLSPGTAGGSTYSVVVVPTDVAAIGSTIAVQLPATNPPTSGDGYSDAAGNRNVATPTATQSYTLSTTTSLVDNGLTNAGPATPIAPGGTTTDRTPLVTVTLGAVLATGQTLELLRSSGGPATVVATLAAGGSSLSHQEGSALAPGTYEYSARVSIAGGASSTLDLTPSTAGNGYSFTIA